MACAKHDMRYAYRDSATGEEVWRCHNKFCKATERRVKAAEPEPAVRKVRR